MKTTTKTIRLAKGERALACLTVYDAVTARIASNGGADLVLIGDSMGNTVLGFENSVPVTLEMIEHHTAAVARAKPDALIVADIPFAVAHDEFSAVLHACARLMRTGAEAVKIEGGVALAPLVTRLTAAGIPVCGHVGLQPQQVFQLGGYRKFGTTEGSDEVESVIADALAIERAGAFAIVGEMLSRPLAAKLRDELVIPLIGIGSGPTCDGQILVIHDLLGLTEKPPAFAKPYANLGTDAVNAVTRWVTDVRAANT
ncbi:MAG: 3-methyl-2-oxobutanoate hydroxymethyltransferase [Puniceicoccales bacterium]|jgi:3-methyl-2-oxobutanoate hydroxymethyltransferase|nr:3-methyl-2-oxobutanoate hydroxymethyltransferase [Puniceicoccales bacterium]